MPFAASLLAGLAAVVFGAHHSTHATPDSALSRDVWITLVLVVIVANAAALAVVVSAARHRNQSLAALSASIRELGSPSAELTPHTRVHSDGALAAMHDAIMSAHSRIRDTLVAARMESDRNRAIIDTVCTSVFAVDGGGRIISANPAATRMFALPVGTLEGVLLSDLVAADTLRMSVDEFGSVTFTGTDSDHHFSTRIRLFGRRSFPAEVSVTPLMLEGQRAWAVLVHDMTEQLSARVEVEDARVAAASANRAKTAFLARMSHELRTPLNSMIGFTKIVRRSRSSQLSERDSHYLDRVQAGTQHLLSLVNDILDLSRIEAGTIDLQLASTDISPIVREIVSYHEERLADRPVILDAVLPDSAAMATVDATRLRQVLTNLIGNAVKFTARGSVQVTVTLDHETGAASAVIVRDTGIGIPLERQAHIFESFEQADEDTSHRYGGSGLGLALSRRIAQQMGCMLSVESMPGAGSTFTLAFTHTNAVPVSVSRIFQIDAA